MKIAEGMPVIITSDGRCDRAIIVSGELVAVDDPEGPGVMVYHLQDHRCREAGDVGAVSRSDIRPDPDGLLRIMHAILVP